MCGGVGGLQSPFLENRELLNQFSAGPEKPFAKVHGRSGVKLGPTLGPASFPTLGRPRFISGEVTSCLGLNSLKLLVF